MDVLHMESVAKGFGALAVLRNLSFSVPKGSVCGLVGKNGAGKTTAMKLILGFLAPDAGQITVCGRPVRYGGAGTNQWIGYLPDVPEFYGFMRPEEYLAFCGRIAGMEPGLIRRRSRELLALVGLEGANRKIRGFSRGMKQRLGIAQAMLGEPRLLIADEPTSALDPLGRREVLEILSKAGKHTAVLFSTHILSDVERICDRVAFLGGGEIALQGPLEDIRNRFRRNAVRIRLLGGRPGALAEKCRGLPFVTAVSAQEDELTVRLADAQRDGPKLLELLARQEVPVLKYEVQEPTLEDVFLEVIS